MGKGECRFNQHTPRVGESQEGKSTCVHTDKADSRARRDGGHVQGGQTTQDGGKLTEGLAGTALRLLWGLVWEPDGT